MESGKISGRSKRIQNLSSRLNNKLAAGEVINDDHNCNLATASNFWPVLEDQPAVLSVPVSDEMKMKSCPSKQLSAPVATGIDSNEPTP